MGLCAQEKFSMGRLFRPGRTELVIHPAVIEALDFVIRHPSKFSNLPIDIHIDSLLVYTIAHDLVTPSSHHGLVAHLRQLFSLVSAKFDLAILKIAGHSGHEGNERADALAARGVHSFSNIGRRHPPVRSLISQNDLPTFFRTTILSTRSILPTHAKRLSRL